MATALPDAEYDRRLAAVRDRLAAVDDAVRDYFEEQGVPDLARHHVGHNIGLGAHEPPYVDRGRTTHCAEREAREEADATMEPGHVYTIEPGIYTDEAGYRHSDTVPSPRTGPNG